MYFAVVYLLLRLPHSVLLSSNKLRLIHKPMKTIKILLFLTLISSPLFAQETKNISHWKVSVSNTAKPGQEAEVVFSATIDKDWKLYSSDFKGDIGPLPTEFKFEDNKGYQLVGDIVAIGPLKTVDPTWDVAYTYFLEKAEFRQKIKVVKQNSTVKGTIKGLLCNNKDGICIPFQETFQVN